uniref:Beta/gamma crystallin 'Greek key' domain-containing protein n=1 Tax=Astatotilapia calliptera TaxID=8154 RepID=A0A3P8QR67_ASTCA
MALNNPNPLGPWKITVYDQENFQGKRLEFTSACQNIMECGVDNIRSLKVECGAWAGYEHSSFCGQQFVLERGEYPYWESWSGSNAYHIERMMSFRPICSANHKESKMVLFEKENFMGRQWEINDDYPSLQAMGWGNNEIGSMQVQSGAWVCYQFPGAVAASNPAMRPRGLLSQPLALYLLQIFPPAPPLPPLTQSFQHLLVLYHRDVYDTFLVCCQMKIKRKHEKNKRKLKTGHCREAPD